MSPYKSPETLRRYAEDWAEFVTWCCCNDLPPLPADSDTIARFLQISAETCSAKLLVQRAAAISFRHRKLGYPSPNADPTIKSIVRGREKVPNQTRAALASADLAVPKDSACDKVRPYKSPEAHELSVADWADFVSWCEGSNFSPLPAAPTTLAGYLRSAAATEGAVSLVRRAAVVGEHHRRHGYASPVGDPQVKTVLRDARRLIIARRSPRPASRPVDKRPTAVRSAPNLKTQTRKAANWDSFVAWCIERGLCSLPASAETVISFLRFSASRVGPTALGQRIAAIRARHREHGHEALAADRLIRMFLADARRTAVPRRIPRQSVAEFASLAARGSDDEI